MRKLDLPKYLRPANWMKETGAFLLDFLFCFLLAVLLYASIGHPLLYRAFQGPEAQLRQEDLAVEAGFSYRDEEGRLHHYEIDTSVKGDEAVYRQYVDAERRVFEYFTLRVAEGSPFCFLESDGFSSSASPASPAYRRDVGKWVYESFFGISAEEAHPLWARVPADFDYATMPKPNASMQEKLDSDVEETRLSAYRDFYEAVVGIEQNDTACLYSRAIAHFKAQPAVRAAGSQGQIAFFASLYPSILLSPVAFFLLPPLFLKNGQTFGKKICKIALVGEDGYAAKTSATLLHYGIIVALFYLFLIPYPLFSFMAFSFLFLLDYVSLILSRYHQSLHAKIARTLSIDAENSVWFASKEAEESYVLAHPSSLAARIRKEESRPESAELLSSLEREEHGILDSATLRQNPFAKAAGEESENEGKEEEN